MLRTCFCSASIAVLMAPTLVRAYYGGPDPFALTAKRADVIVLATATAVEVNQEGTAATVMLRISGALKGQPGAAILQASIDFTKNPTEFRPSSTAGPSRLKTAIIGGGGVWFLGADPSGFHVVPMSHGMVLPEDLFLRESPQSLAVIPPGTLYQQLLNFVVQWYRDLPAPGLVEDTRLLASFYKGHPSMSDVNVTDLLAAANELAASVMQPQHVMGLVIALQLGSHPALSEVVTEVDSLKDTSKFENIVQAVASYPSDPAAVPILAQEVALRTDAPGLDDAAASALSGLISNRSVPPVMAELLDSKDETAQLRAARFFSIYTLLSDAHGNIIEGSPDGPFATLETRSFAPGADATKTPNQCVQFWKQWWAENAPRLGFPAN